MCVSSNQKLSYSERGMLGYLAAKEACQKAKQVRHTAYHMNPKLCKNCGKSIPFEKRTQSIFCSRSCACTYNNFHRANIIRVCSKCGRQFEARSGFASYCSICVCSCNTNAPTKDLAMIRTVKCLNCGKAFVPHNNRRGRRYCSVACFHQHRNNEIYNTLLQYIENTGEFPTYGGSVTKGETNRDKVRLYLESTHGHKCSICGITEWQGKPAPLIVDHIDGNPTNHKVDNFRLVCPNCDAQLPTYKSKTEEKEENIEGQKKWTVNSHALRTM